MTKKPQSDRTRARGLPPSPEFWILDSDFRILPKNAKRTQFAPAHPAKTRNKPNLPSHHPTIYYLLSAICCFPQNKPNLSHGGPVEDQKMQNKPNSRPARNPNAQNKPNSRIPSAPPHTKRAKQTQFTVPYTIPWPNLPPQSPCQPCHSRKGAESRNPHPRPKNGKQTQSPCQLTLPRANISHPANSAPTTHPP